MAEVQPELFSPQHLVDRMHDSGFGGADSDNITSPSFAKVEMETQTPSDKVKDKEFINWMKLALVLYYMKSGLKNFVNKSLYNLHKSIRENIHGGTNMSKTERCTTCNEGTVRKHMPAKSSYQCKSYCLRWVKALLERHVTGCWTHVDWKQIEIPELQFKPWECAKVFMSRQLKHSSAGPHECDHQALLTLLSNCKFFHEKLSVQGIGRIQHIINIRNNLMHNSEMRITDSVLRNYTNEVINLLQDHVSLKSEEDSNTAVDNIEKVLQLSSLYSVADKLREMLASITEIIPKESIDATTDTIQNILGTLKHTVMDTIDVISDTVNDVLKTSRERSTKHDKKWQERSGPTRAQHEGIATVGEHTLYLKVQLQLDRLNDEDKMTTENKLLELFANNESKDVLQQLTEILERELECQLINIEQGCIALVIVTTDKRRCTGLYRKNNQRIKDAIRQCLLKLMKKIPLTTDSDDFNIDLKLLDTEEENLENKRIKSAAGDSMFPDNRKMDTDVDRDDDSDDDPDSSAAKIGGHRSGSIHEVIPSETLKQHTDVTYEKDVSVDDDADINRYDDSGCDHDIFAEGIQSNTKGMGLDGRGVQRGKCKDCKDCGQFKRDLKCEYCNCTASQHVNLAMRAADNESRTSASETMPKIMGLDGRGVQRGKCKGCNDCNQFNGDLKCEYCNCTAAQHINLAVRGADHGVGTSTSETMPKSKGLDGRGVQRGKCKGCKDCSQFKGDLKCEYCNCTAAQHVNLAVRAATNEAGTSTSDTMPKTKGLDGRGVRRGKCKGCNECDQFKGDLKCDYCNCTAAQHVNLAVRGADHGVGTSTSETMPKSKGLDGRGVRRGKCKGCNDCNQFKGDMKCDYCNCTAAQHVNLAVRTADNGVGTSTSETMPKSKGLDGRGVQRGKCKGCNDCNQFKGDLKCEYCNCTAAQHVNLAVRSGTNETETSTSETMPKAKGLDGRGVQRGKCKGCNDCNQFNGDMKCDYCNCTAAQHINLAVRGADHGVGTSTSETMLKSKGLDGRGVRRGKCKGCNDCNQFKGDLKCDYCNCTAAQHVNLAVRTAGNDVVNSSFESIQKDLDNQYDKIKIQLSDTLVLLQEKEGFNRLKIFKQLCCNQRLQVHKLAKQLFLEVMRGLLLTILQEPKLDKDLLQVVADQTEKYASINKHQVHKLDKDLLQEPKLDKELLQEPKLDKDLLQGSVGAMHNTGPLQDAKKENIESTQNYKLTIDLQYESREELDEGTKIELESRLKKTIEEKHHKIRTDIREAFGVQFEEMEFQNGSIVVILSTDQPEAMAESQFMQRKIDIEQWANRLVQHVFPFEFGNNSHEQFLKLRITMDRFFSSTKTLILPPTSRTKNVNKAAEKSGGH